MSTGNLASVKQNILHLKSINDLLDLHFFIPSYQRGYRWQTTQVRQLIDDLWEFRNRPKEAEEFYCLQPIAVKKYDDKWEVIDGQQRLTTILILLYYFNETEFKNPRKIFDLTYQTRTDSSKFLANIQDSSFASQNIDYYHIHHAYNCIQKWFSEKEISNQAIRSEFYPILINLSKVIWYEVNDDTSSYDIFTRLNIGKIQLTNSELIKALFLKQWNLNDSIDYLRLQQLQIATEWDNIENKLQNDAFWFFICNERSKDITKYQNRIEYIFDLMKQKPKDADDKFTFFEFVKAFEESKVSNDSDYPDAEYLWLEVKNYFLTFEEWYNDRDLYHLIGFLIEKGKDNTIQNLIKEKQSKTKSDFKDYLISEIRKSIDFDLRSLVYPDKNIKTILLLFNIETMRSNIGSNLRFPFNLYKTIKWDIEHVRSQTDKDIKGKDRIVWAKEILKYFTGCEKLREQQEYLHNAENTENTNKSKLDIDISILSSLLKLVEDEDIDEKEFSEVYNFLRKFFKEDLQPNKAQISNLVLLDSITNRRYKNAFFPVKRGVIFETDTVGTFMPICTKNVFMKAYSKRYDEIMYWNSDDAEAYMKTIEETLQDYLKVEKTKKDDSKR